MLKIGKDGLLELKNSHHNKALQNLVTNRDEIEKIFEAEDELIQKKDPVFKTPDSNMGNAHFYAPVKVLGHLQIGTFSFNIIIIWLMTAFLYMTLYYDALRKCLAFITNNTTKH